MDSDSEPATSAPPPGRASWRFSRSSTRSAVMLASGVVAAVVTGIAGSWRYAPIVGLDATSAAFAAWMWAATARMDPASTAAHATRDDPSRGVGDLIVLTAAVASIAAVGVLLFQAPAAHGRTRAVLAGLALFSVAVSWLAVNTLFTVRYALLYYAGSGAGIDFNQSESPRYTDFAYLAFTVGMTYQVSDTDLKTHPIRMTALRHALLSYAFGAIILAATINLLVSLTSGS